MKYYLSLGSNINAEKNIAFAIKELSKIFSNVIISSTHSTKAEGFEGDDFLNLVLAGDSKLDFDSLNKELKTIENASGRKRDVPKFCVYLGHKLVEATRHDTVYTFVIKKKADD